jgi:hypothetical protein
MHELPSISLQRVGLVRLTAGLLLAATLGELTAITATRTANV